MKRWLLDTSALLTLRDDEPGAADVADVLSLASTETTIAYACFMTLVEVHYRVWKDENERAGILARQQVLELPLTWVNQSPELMIAAAKWKATTNISLADAWIAAAAELQGAVLMHKDPEFSPLPLPQHVLPLKPSRGNK